MGLLRLLLPLALASTATLADADRTALSGGATTVFHSGQNAFSLPLANITRENRRAHVIGNSFFNKNWVFAPASTSARDGLGPFFNARSCSQCHLRDGRSVPTDNVSPLPALLFRFGNAENGESLSHPLHGRQLAPFSIPEMEPEGEVIMRYEEEAGTYDDGSPYSLQKPSYSLRTSTNESEDSPVRLAPRAASPVFGLGLLEAIPVSEILRNEDSSDRDGDGISGRANRILHPETGETVVGRFGWKANQFDLRQQTAAAFVNDIGITSSIHPQEDLTGLQRDSYEALAIQVDEEPEVDDKTLNRVVRYLQTLAVPARRNIDDPAVLEGEKLFRSIGCASCHIEKWTTVAIDPSLPEVGGQIIHPYTDLLLHDMGPGMADGRRDGEANGSEWRTPPLWGIGLTKAVNGHTRFLHDGRARNLEEAILWHGGEAEAAKEAFRAAPQTSRRALINFLESL